VQHAHQSLVVHRDLKPANILVDAEGEPKLLDFGIAKLLDPRSSGGMTALTGPGPMTPDYASPEQRAGGPVTTATDVYGLGLLLYEILVGKNPRAVERKLGEGWSGRPPSEALVALGEPGDAETRRLARRVAGDLDTIAGKALEPEPEQRYGTAAALAEDVERHLAQQPVTARRPTLAYRLSRTLARHKLAASLALVVCLLAAFVSYLIIASRQARARAEAQRQIAHTLDEFLTGMIKKADPGQTNGETLTVRQVLDAAPSELLIKDARRNPEVRAALFETLGNTYDALGLDEKAQGYLEQALKLRERQLRLSLMDRLITWLVGDRGRQEALLATAATWTFLGDVTSLQGKYDLSRHSYQRALAIRKGQLGPTALPLVEDWNGLGLVAREEGDLQTAEGYFAKSLAVSRASEDGQRDLAETLDDLGKLANSRGKFKLAQLYFQAAWHYFRFTLGDDNPDTIEVRNNLAAALDHRGDHAAAEAQYQEIVALRRRLLGPDHPDLAHTLLDLAIVQRERGHPVEARATLEEILRIRREHSLPLDDGEAETWHYVGRVDLDQNQLDAAEAAFQKSFDIYRSLHGEHRLNLAFVLDGQAQVRRRRGDLAGALALARRSLELTRAATGETSSDTAGSLKRLADLLQEKRRGL
jgi:tetratricopeptide (TPR) repeat protein